MARGVLSGFITGGVVSTAAVAVVSVLVGPPEAPNVTSAAPAAQADAPEPVAQSATPAVTTTDSAPAQPEASAVTAPEPEVSPDVVDTADTPVAQPDVATETTTLADPVEPNAQEDVAVSALEPVYPNPQARAPEAPEAETSAILSTTPPEAPVEAAPVEVTPDLDDTQSPVAPEVTENVQPVTTTADAQEDLAPSVPEAPDQPQKSDAPEIETEPAAPVTVAEPNPAPDATVSEADEETQQTAQGDPAEDAPALPDNSTSAQPEDTDTTAMVVPANRVTIGRPATSLLDRSDENGGARLPGVQPVSDEAGDTDEEPLVAADGSSSGPALTRFAEAFDNVDDRPLMSIVLIDRGENLSGGSVGFEALQSFPYKLSFAIDASLADAADRAAIYRAQGFEVLALIDLPSNLTAADTEVAMTAALEAVPEAVAVLEGTKDGLQGSKDMSDQISEILLDTGHGIVWQPNGLDTAQKLAAREGVASETLFRDFDNKDQSARTIRRFLDQAAFKAGQSGAVIMVGRLRPDTISALLVWGLQDRAARVAVAPVSAVLARSAQ